MAYEDCMGPMRSAAGGKLTDDEMAGTVLDVHAAAQEHMRAGLSAADAARRGAADVADRIRMAAAIEKRNRLLNLEKRLERRNGYSQAREVRGPLGGKTSAPVMGLESKLVGVNTPWSGSRKSAAALQKSYAAQYIGGLAADLRKGGLLRAWRSGAVARDWARELFELNKKDGNPGVTKNKMALDIARTVHKYQRLSVDDVNAAGGWIGDYDGYIARTSHDADKIAAAGFETWAADARKYLDLDRSFAGPGALEGRLRDLYADLSSGVHLRDDGNTGKEPAFTGPANMARRASQSRSLHFRDANAWLDYQALYGRGNVSDAVVDGLRRNGESAGLMSVWGTNPRAELDGDIQHLTEQFRADASTRENLKNSTARLSAMMDQLDGTARMPANRLMARIGWWVRWQQQMSKLGGMVFSHFGLLMSQAAELRYQGVGLGESYWNGIKALFPHGINEETADLLRAGHEGALASLTSSFHPEMDGVPGTAAKLADRFFQLTGMKYVVEHMRAGAETMMSRHLGRALDHGWDDLQPETQRLLSLYGIDADRWAGLRAVPDHTTDGEGRRFLTPDAAQRIANVGDRRSLETDLHALFADRADYATNAADARERAMMFGSTRPGSAIGEAVRAFWQFKPFAATTITKSLGRELYGGQTRWAMAGGLIHMAVMGTLFGMTANALKDMTKFREPRPWDDPRTWLAGLVQGGGAGLMGDFLFGEANRFGGGPLESLAGPAMGTAGDLVRTVWQARQDALDGGRFGHNLAANLFGLAKNNTPFLNLFYSRMALDYLFLWQVQEAISPGYQRRLERRIRQQNDQAFWLSPARRVQEQ